MLWELWGSGRSWELSRNMHIPQSVGVVSTNMWRCLLCFLTPRGVPATTTETFCDSWKIHGKSIHGKSMENRMEKPWTKPWTIPWEIHGKSMGNPWIIETEKRKCFRGTPWGPHGGPWAPMRNHGFPWVPMGFYGFPGVPMGPMGSHGSP